MRMSKYTAEIVWEWEEQCFAADVWEFMRVVWCFVRVVERGSVIEVAEGVRVVWEFFLSDQSPKKQNTDMTNAKSSAAQTLHIQNRHKNGHDMTNA